MGEQKSERKQQRSSECSLKHRLHGTRLRRGRVVTSLYEPVTLLAASRPHNVCKFVTLKAEKRRGELLFGDENKLVL